MVGSDLKWQAPKVNALAMWQMPDKDFNAWRRAHDYPRIVSYLKEKQPEFKVWMEDQEVTDDLLIEHSPSTFLKEQHYLYLYQVLHKSSEEKQILSSTRHSVGETFFHENFVKQRKDIIPYPVWYRQKLKKRVSLPSITSKSGRSHFMGGLELLDLGSCHISGMFIGSRLLDFVNVSDMQITNCINNTAIKLWFCSASNITIQGDLAFVDAYETSFYEVFFLKYRNLKLINGNYQRWSLINCEVNITASNAILHSWDFIGWDFNATINNTDINECTFKHSRIDYPLGYGRVKNFHAHVKRLYSQLGKKSEASQHYYWEKTFQRKSYLHIRENHRDQYLRRKTKSARNILKGIFILKYLYSGFLNILWGYGERPGRVFIISLVTIFLFAFGYCYLPNASTETFHHFGNALYYSMVTFTTLGYGDISQSKEYLKLLSGLEALFGMSFWGILIAGFTSNAKDY